MIIQGHIPPGLRLTENDVAGRFGASRTPAREALRRLQADGLVAPVGEGGRVELAVAPLTRDDLVEVYLVMGALEGAAARGVGALAVAERRALFASLEEAEATFEKVARTDPRALDRLFETRNAVHTTLVERCAGPRLRQLLERARPLADRYEWLYAPMVGPVYDPTFAEHRAILSAVRAGDADRAEAAVRANWSNSAERLLEAFDRWGALGGWPLDGGAARSAQEGHASDLPNPP
jgi:DNA-binding GntR family transcriptional regulator